MTFILEEIEIEYSEIEQEIVLILLCNSICQSDYYSTFGVSMDTSTPIPITTSTQQVWEYSASCYFHIKAVQVKVSHQVNMQDM